MANASLFITGLRSRRIRSRTLGANFTSRQIGSPTPQPEGGVLSTIRDVLGGIVSGTGRVAGWLFGGIAGLGFSAIGIVSTLQDTFQFIMNFNWNVTDDELDRNFRSLLLRLSGQLGGTLGNLAGRVVCGVGAGAAIAVINEPLALYVLKEVGEEALDDFLTNLRLLLRTSFYGLAQLAFITTYKNIRRTVKLINNDPTSPQSIMARKIFGEGITRAIRQWGEEGTKPWSFNIAQEQFIESIENPFLENFVEEFVDEFGDSCWESFYVAAAGIDNWVMQERLRQELGDNSQQSYEITPNREAPEERVIISGNSQEIRTQAITVMNTHQLIDNRDLGMWVGEPLRSDVRKKPSGIFLRVQLFNSPTPPFFRNTEDLQRVTITIPGIKRSKLDWAVIKEAVGGNTGYLWGRWLASAKLVDTQDRYAGEMKIWGGSEAEAERRFRRCLELSEYKLQTLSVTEQKQEGIRATNKRQHKKTTRVYPGYMTVINSEKVLREDQGVSTVQGTYIRKRDRILLWQNEKPDNFELTIQRLLSSTIN